MNRRFLRALLTFTSLGIVATGSTAARDLTFEDRVRCQESIERVYYSHQIGATRPFEEVVPRSVLEKKVRTYLKQSLALKELWNTPVTAEMLSRETERILGSTRTPDRLRELYAALDGDTFLFQECVARATLVDRLTHNFFAYDERFHSATRVEAEDLRTRLARGEKEPDSRRIDRTVADLVRSDAAAIQMESNRGKPLQPGGRDKPAPMKVTSKEFDRWRSRLPERVGEVSAVSEDPYGFAVRKVLSKAPGDLKFSTYYIRKRTWDDWWGQVADDFQETSVVPVARAGNPSVTDRFDRVAGAPATMSSASAGTDSVGGPQTVCTPEDSWDGGLRSSPPLPRYRHVAVWTGSLMIVWGGGDDSSDVSHQDGGRYDPLTDTWTPTSLIDAPYSDPEHETDNAVWTGKYMIVFGTVGGAKYDPVADKWSRISMENAPFREYGHTEVWTGTDMLVWGGAYCEEDHDTCGSTCSTGARYNPETDAWSPIATLNAPACRAGHSAIWTGAEMVIWGGWGGSGEYRSSGGRYNPVTDTWRPTSLENAPEGRTGHAAVWTGELMVVGGGRDGYERVGSGGRYNPVTDTWTPTSSIGAPVAYSFGSVWTGSLMVVWPLYGGTEGGRYDPVSDRWMSISTENAPAGTLLPVWTGSLMLVWGVASYPEGLADGARGGRYDPVADVWTPMTTGPDVREGHTAVWTGNHMIVWGGFRIYDRAIYPPGARYDPATDSWAIISTTQEPEGRIGHTAVWTGETMVIWGGESDYCPTWSCSNGGRYNPATDTWSSVALENAPTGLAYHAAVWSGTEMIVWGGKGGRYNPVSDTWRPMAVENAPTSGTAVWSGTEMIVWDGKGGRYNPVTDTWRPMAVENASTGTAVWTGTEMIVWGGEGSRYNPVTDTWRPTAMQNSPQARDRHTAIWTGTAMVVWGGWAGSALNSGGRYYPATDTWSPTTTENAPEGRIGHTAVWTGNQMLVWGGYFYDTNRGYTQVNNGARYTPDPPVDGDGDGYGECDGDFNDADPSVHPGAVESCNGIDDDCDGVVDEGLAIGRLSIVLTPSTLWPPNHRLVDVRAAVANVGGCNPAGNSVTLTLLSVTSSEPDDAPGDVDGRTTNDIQGALTGTADFSFRLRAERSNKGPGRTYTVTYRAKDGAGNTATAAAYVTVPAYRK